MQGGKSQPAGGSPFLSLQVVKNQTLSDWGN